MNKRGETPAAQETALNGDSCYCQETANGLDGLARPDAFAPGEAAVACRESQFTPTVPLREKMGQPGNANRIAGTRISLFGGELDALP